MAPKAQPPINSGPSVTGPGLGPNMFGGFDSLFAEVGPPGPLSPGSNDPEFPYPSPSSTDPASPSNPVPPLPTLGLRPHSSLVDRAGASRVGPLSISPVAIQDRQTHCLTGKIYQCPPDFARSFAEAPESSRRLALPTPHSASSSRWGAEQYDDSDDGDGWGWGEGEEMGELNMLPLHPLSSPGDGAIDLSAPGFDAVVHLKRVWGITDPEVVDGIHSLTLP
eukprot:gene2845-3443_t